MPPNWFSTALSETPHRPRFFLPSPAEGSPSRASAAISYPWLLHIIARDVIIRATDQSPPSGSLPMSSEVSVTPWLRRLKAGDRGAAEPLWQVYCHRLIALARARLRDAPRRAADEEDVALSAFDSFCRRAER